MFCWLFRLTDRSLEGKSTISPPTTDIDGDGDSCTLLTTSDEVNTGKTVLEAVGCMMLERVSEDAFKEMLEELLEELLESTLEEVLEVVE